MSSRATTKGNPYWIAAPNPNMVAAGPSGIVAEMFQAAGDPYAVMVFNLATSIVRDGKIPKEWEEIFIIVLFKGKGDDLVHGNYRGLI